jgi:tRNA 5-methylaminomethyl-2-thiouridine biosynthesis bifunctional protein
MPEPLVPARLAFAADGTPYSEDFGDVFHSAAGGPDQARHVFLAGNGLPERWRGRDRFVILETGFGFGLNFLATWQAWRADPERCARLHFVSIEKHPFTLADLRALHTRYAEFAPLAAELQARWPLLVPGVQRIELDGERVVLTLFFGDIAEAGKALRLAADAIYLDGFAPAKNPDMWSATTIESLARLSAPSATAATWSTAAALREALAASGFEVEKRAGFAAKREMTVARFAPRDRAHRPASVHAERLASVIGAGIAGAAVAERLCARGWDVALIERRARPAEEGSGNPAGVFHPVVTLDDNVLARLTRAGSLYTEAHWTQLAEAGHAPRWERCGVLQLARDAREEVSQRHAIEALGYPPEYARLVERGEASALAGVEVSGGGLWFERSGWASPSSVVSAQLAACGARLETIYGREVATLSRDGGMWSARDARGNDIARAPLVLLANSSDAARFVPSLARHLRRVRGQISYLPPPSLRAVPRTVVLRGGIVLPPVDDRVIVGATYDYNDDDSNPRASSHAANLERLAHILPGAQPKVEVAALEGRVGFRCVTRDRLPIVGALGGENGLYGAIAYGSRGLVWASLLGELLACLIEDEPLPLDARLADSLSPARLR